MQPELSAAIAAAYRTFPDYGLGGPLLVCTCNVCMSPAMAKAIEGTAREHLTAEQLGGYLNSVHAADDPVAVHQLRWLLPRLLECCATGPWPYPMTEHTFGKLKAAGYPAWPDAEKAVVRDMFLGLFAAGLTATRAGVGDHPEDLLEAFVRAGEPVEPYLEHWDRDQSEPASVALAELIAWRLTFVDGRPGLRFDNAWDSPPAIAAFTAWLDRPETVARLQDAFFAAHEAVTADLLSIAHQALAR